MLAQLITVHFEFPNLSILVLVLFLHTQTHHSGSDFELQYNNSSPPVTYADLAGIPVIPPVEARKQKPMQFKKE